MLMAVISGVSLSTRQYWHEHWFVSPCQLAGVDIEAGLFQVCLKWSIAINCLQLKICFGLLSSQHPFCVEKCKRHDNHSKTQFASQQLFTKWKIYFLPTRLTLLLSQVQNTGNFPQNTTPKIHKATRKCQYHSNPEEVNFEHSITLNTTHSLSVLTKIDVKQFNNHQLTNI